MVKQVIQRQQINLDYPNLEDSTSHGRIDMAVLLNGQVYLFEFKVGLSSHPQERSKRRFTPAVAPAASEPHCRVVG